MKILDFFFPHTCFLRYMLSPEESKAALGQWIGPCLSWISHRSGRTRVQGSPRSVDWALFIMDYHRSRRTKRAACPNTLVCCGLEGCWLTQSSEVCWWYVLA